MEQTKRPLNDIATNNKRTKIQINITKFEDFSNEIFYEIFEYLDCCHMYEAFSSLNQRFHDLINSTLRININISTMSKSMFESFNTNMIIPNIDRIRSLHVSNRFIYDLPLSPTSMLSKFCRLERLKLDNIDIKYIEKMLLQLTSLSFLSSLIIIGIDYRDDAHYMLYSGKIRNVICHQIFRLPALKYCNLALHARFDDKPLPVAKSEYSSIEHLVIDNVINITEMNSLLSYVPHIRRLDVHSLQSDMQTAVRVSSPELKHITHVSLKFDCETLHEVEEVIVTLFSRVEVLRISIEHSHDEKCEERDIWQQLIWSHMPKLRIFDIQHLDWPISNERCDYKRVSDAEINPFISSFWNERQSFFDYQVRQPKRGHCIFFHSTNPYRRIKCVVYAPSRNKTHLNSHKTNLQSVCHVNIQSEKGMINCTHDFPNTNALTLGDNYTKHRNSLFTTLNNIIPLKQLSKLIIQLKNFPFIKIIELLCFMPNIHILELDSISLFGNTIQNIEQNESFRLVSNRNSIAVVTIHDLCTLEKIQLLIDLCPRMRSLAFHTLTKNSQLIARFLIENTKRNAHPLNALCFLQAGQYWYRKLNALIQSEALLNDYMLKQFGDSLHLWW